jgi:hypothetical protein
VLKRIEVDGKTAGGIKRPRSAFLDCLATRITEGQETPGPPASIRTRASSGGGETVVSFVRGLVVPTARRSPEKG